MGGVFPNDRRAVLLVLVYGTCKLCKQQPGGRRKLFPLAAVGRHCLPHRRWPWVTTMLSTRLPMVMLTTLPAQDPPTTLKRNTHRLVHKVPLLPLRTRTLIISPFSSLELCCAKSRRRGHERQVRAQPICFLMRS